MEDENAKELILRRKKHHLKILEERIRTAEENLENEEEYRESEIEKQEIRDRKVAERYERGLRELDAYKTHSDSSLQHEKRILYNYEREERRILDRMTHLTFLKNKGIRDKFFKYMYTWDSFFSSLHYTELSLTPDVVRDVRSRLAEAERERNEAADRIRTQMRIIADKEKEAAAWIKEKMYLNIVVKSEAARFSGETERLRQKLSDTLRKLLHQLDLLKLEASDIREEIYQLENKN